MSTAPDTQKCTDSLSLLTLVRFEPAASSDGSGLAKGGIFKRLWNAKKHLTIPTVTLLFPHFPLFRKLYEGKLKSPSASECSKRWRQVWNKINEYKVHLYVCWCVVRWIMMRKLWSKICPGCEIGPGPCICRWQHRKAILRSQTTLRLSRIER